MAFTKRDVDQLAWDDDGAKSRQIKYEEGEVPGFGVRLYRSGAKSYVLQYRTSPNAPPRLKTIGKANELTLQEAREKARADLVKARAGEDPMAEVEVRRKAGTVKDLADQYIERHAKPNKKTWKEDERRIRKHILPAWRRRLIADVRRADVEALHDRIARDAPYEANRVLALVGAMFNKALDWGMLPEVAPNPAARVKPKREMSRDRWVTESELPALMRAIDGEPSPHVRAAFRLYLLTGLRRSELLGLRWSDVDLDRRELRLEETKANRRHYVPLSTPAESHESLKR